MEDAGGALMGFMGVMGNVVGKDGKTEASYLAQATILCAPPSPPYGLTKKEKYWTKRNVAMQNYNQLGKN